MIKPAALLLAGAFLTIAAPLCAQTTDLSSPGAFERLRMSNPGHYEKLRQIVAGFTASPSRVESDWLAETFGATDLHVARPSAVFSDLAKQSVRFTLDGSQYRIEVVRTDLTFATDGSSQTLLR